MLCSSEIFKKLFLASVINISTAVNCPCGYYDPVAKDVFTESLIVYFNETSVLPIPGFVVEAYEHKFEKGWNTRFCRGASLSNVAIAATQNDSRERQSLELQVAPAQQNHLVVGGSLRTLRRDIQYGSFTSLMRSPGPWAGGGGSALAMALQYNVTQLITMSMQNKDVPLDASISMRESDEFPDSDVALPYSNITNGTFADGQVNPWEYVVLQMIWTKTQVMYYVGGQLARTVSREFKRDLFSIPSPLYLRHGSSGNNYSTQGPPKQMSSANVGWLRAFFNSSLMTEKDHASFDARCQISDACQSDDYSLRHSTSYSEAALLEWRQKEDDRPTRWIAIWIAVASISFTTILLLSPVWKRLRERYNKSKNRKFTTRKKPKKLEANWDLDDFSAATLAGSLSPTSATQMSTPSPRSKTFSRDTSIPYDSIESPKGSTPIFGHFSERNGSFCKETLPSSVEGPTVVSATTEMREEESRTFSGKLMSFMGDGYMSSSGPSRKHSNTVKVAEEKPKVVREKSVAFSRDIMSDQHKHTTEQRLGSMKPIICPEQGANTQKKKSIAFIPDTISNQHVGAPGQVQSSATPTPTPRHMSTARKKSIASYNVNPLTSLSPPQKFIDHLAGLISLSCLLVTAVHFSLTFVYGAVVPGAFNHYRAEIIVRKTIGPFLLNFIWIGPFLLTSTRFLISNFLQTGDLLPLAEKTIGRIPRLMIPVTMMVVIEYFFIDCGATKWLEYLPSVSWSTWPFTHEFKSFIHFINETLELMYLIPNAAPNITLNYCTGVLWTIPVQLQGSWLTLLAILVIREIKTPWKRFGFYAFCITSHWYALSWGSYFYVGIMITDLDLTYKWRLHLYAKPLAYYPLLLLCVTLALGGLSVDLIPGWTNMDLVTYEHAIHPDVLSSLSISQAGKAAYPDYFVPRLNGLLFAVGIQAAVELSPLVQKVFSCRFLMLTFPHVFTIYLVHGFIFWSFGSWLCITLAVQGLPYWLDILIVAICCYVTITLSLPVLTPAVSNLGKSVAMDIWGMAREGAVPRQPTLHPFPADFLVKRSEPSHSIGPSNDMVTDKVKDTKPSITNKTPEPNEDHANELWRPNFQMV